MDKNPQFVQQCHINYVSVYARASARLLLAGHDVRKAKIRRGKRNAGDGAQKLRWRDFGSGTVRRRCSCWSGSGKSMAHKRNHAIFVADSAAKTL